MVNKHSPSAGLPECQGTVGRTVTIPQASSALFSDMNTTNKTLRMYRCKPGRTTRSKNNRLQFILKI